MTLTIPYKNNGLEQIGCLVGKHEIQKVVMKQTLRGQQMITKTNREKDNPFVAVTSELRPGNATSPADKQLGTAAEEKPVLAEEIDGLKFADFLRKYHLSDAELWHLIRSGQVVARTQGGDVLVYGNYCPSLQHPQPYQQRTLSGAVAQEQAPLSQPDVAAINPQVLNESAGELEEPPLPFAIDWQDDAANKLESIAIGTITPRSPEVALLLDHLSLAKDENREILRLSQEAIRRISSMAEQVLAAKESVLAEREEVIRSKELMIAAQQEQIDRLRSDYKEATKERKELLQSLQNVQKDLRSERAELMEQTTQALQDVAARDIKMQQIQRDIQEREQTIRKLQQSCEDLQMLADTLTRQIQAE